MPILRGKPVLQVIKAMASLGGIPATSQQLMVALVSAPESNRTTKKSPTGVFLVVTKESLPACPRQLNP